MIKEEYQFWIKGGERPRYFEDDDLNNFFMHTYQYLCDQPTIPNTSDSTTTTLDTNASGLAHSLSDCLAFVNIWNYSIKNSARHLLSALQGHLYNHHMFLFLDLERDLEKLDEPLKTNDSDREGAVFMKWRPRLHYLLRSAWATHARDEKEKDRRRACTLFAKSCRDYSREVRDDMRKLEDRIKPVAKYIGVSKLVDRDIEVIDVCSDQKCIYCKIQRIASYTPPEKIPLSWLFLHSSFYHSKNIIISKNELKRKATECGMNDESLSEFCKFYTSFGSIIDLSLANPTYPTKLVITKPVIFLKLLNYLLLKYNPNDDRNAKYPTIKLGIVPELYCEDTLGASDWNPFMKALVSLQLATPVNCGLLQLPPGYSIDQIQTHFYISLCCQGEPVTEVDHDAIYLITNINTPHIFKQVTIAKQLLELMKELSPKLYPHTDVNVLIIKASDTMVTMSFHSPVTKIHLSEPTSIVCSHVVRAFNDIATHAHEASGIKEKYKFVKLCSKNEDIPNVQSLLSSHYHVLPHDGSCKYCTDDDELLKVWNEALKKV